MARLAALAGMALLCLAQGDPPEAERQALREALAEAGSSQVDFLRALENHLIQFPETRQRAELERALVKAAVEIKDNRRLLRYGERVLSREPDNLDLLERVSRVLLSDDDAESAERALDYASNLEKLAAAQPEPPPGSRNAARLAEERLRKIGKALVFQSRATGNLGKLAPAETLARRSWDVYPTAEAAREIGRWLEKQGKLEEAIHRLADAFAIADPAAGPEDRKKDRERLGEWHRRWKGSEAGLGDLVLAAYDRTGTRLGELRAGLVRLEPNAAASSPLDFTLSGLNGERLHLATLKGKVIVLDFWATWCGPCRAQQPLYERVKKHYAGNPGVVFLNVSTDEERGVVKPFLDEMKWNKTIYFEDGLSLFFRVNSIPTTVILNPRGEISSRMNGFIEHRFVDMLIERIEQSLSEK